MNDESGVCGDFDCLIAEKGRFNGAVKRLMTDDQELKCLILVPFNETVSIDMPRLKLISKPACLISLYSSLVSRTA